MKNWKKIIVKILIESVAVAAVLAGAYFAIFVIKKEILKISSAIVEKKELNFALENREATAAGLRLALAQADPEYDKKILAALPLIDDISPFTAAVDSLAGKYSLVHDLNINNPTVRAEGGGTMNLMSLDYGITIENANIRLLSNFIKDFEKLPFFARIDSIELTSGEAGWLGKSAVKITGKFYVRQ